MVHKIVVPVPSADSMAKDPLTVDAFPHTREPCVLRLPVDFTLKGSICEKKSKEHLEMDKANISV